MDSLVLDESIKLFQQAEQLLIFENRYDILPYRSSMSVVQGLRTLSDSISTVPVPGTIDEVINTELKRRLTEEATIIERKLSSIPYDMDFILSAFAIPKEDISDLCGWLIANKQKTLDAIERLYVNAKIKDYESSPSADVPVIRNMTEEFAALNVNSYHQSLGKLLEKLTNAGGFLREITAVPTHHKRSYFKPSTNTLAIAISEICYINGDKKAHLREYELIYLYGHEGMGHALNKIITDTNNLPYFLKVDSCLTCATAESVAQFYARRIFEDLKNSKETQEELKIADKFEEIYLEAQDTAQFKEYKSRLYQYAICVLADKELGEPHDPQTIRKKIRILSEVALNPSYPSYVVNMHMKDFDVDGNLDLNILMELQYCAKPVQRALNEFEKRGILYEGNDRSIIDMALLEGFWTPAGYVDKARLIAEKAQNKQI